jgi:uncharacterized protein (DUF983 family)
MNSISSFQSALKLSCPKCGKSKLFIDPNPYHIKHLGDMPTVCPVCNLPFMPEPGFYYGAMYVSYALTVALSVGNFLWIYLIWGFNVWVYLTINSLLLLVFLPILFRYSRSFYLAMVFSIEKTTSRKTN